MNVKFYRQWHRWIGWTAAIFLLWAGSTGVIVAGTEFFGADEAEREALRAMVSPVNTWSQPTTWEVPLTRAILAVKREAPIAPIDKVELKLKGDHPTVVIYTGKPAGGEDKRYVVDARAATVLSVEDYVDKPLIYRLHSGEWFGDGGLVFAMGWGLALVLMAASGMWIYWRMHPRTPVTGVRKVFW